MRRCRGQVAAWTNPRKGISTFVWPYEAMGVKLLGYAGAELATGDDIAIGVCVTARRSPAPFGWRDAV